MLFEPRMRMRVPVPVVPLLLSTCTPAARPEMRLANSVIGASSATCAALMVATALPTSSFRCSPVAVLTTSSSWTGAASIAKSSVAAASVTRHAAGVRPVSEPEYPELIASRRDVAKGVLPLPPGGLDPVAP